MVKNMKCLNNECDVQDIENDNNFCYKCGHWTAKGYSFLTNDENFKKVINGDAAKKENNLLNMIFIVTITTIVFISSSIIRGHDLFKPIYYLKKQYNNYTYGYATSIIKTENIYNDQIINDINEAKIFIKKDFSDQSWKCNHELETIQYQNILEQKHSIPAVSLCDVSSEEVINISNTINRIYELFPNIEGALTNISITNAKTNSEYIARFQPMFQFVNTAEDFNEYNRINKTQILLNSYYFLNEKMLKKPVTEVVGNNWYVDDVTWESTIAHEFGHYITFVLFLREHNLDSIILVTKQNTEEISNLLSEFSTGSFSRKIINEAMNNYNSTYHTNMNIQEFANSISNYAAFKDKNNNIIADETIAEAVHDYYLHGEDCSKSSLEIINIINKKLKGEL